MSARDDVRRALADPYIVARRFHDPIVAALARLAEQLADQLDTARAARPDGPAKEGTPPDARLPH